MHLRWKASPSLFLISLILAFATAVAAQVPATSSEPSSPNRFAGLDAILEKAVQQQNPPGVVVLVGHDGEKVYRKAFGYRSLEPQREPMAVDTIFDMASLTKCMVTGPASCKWSSRGKYG